jgi:hypothetical protein
MTAQFVQDAKKLNSHKKARRESGNKDINMQNDNNDKCRNTQAEIEREGHAGQHDADGAPYHNTQAEVVRARVEELMDADSTDEDSIVVLLESERFVKVFRKVLSHRHSNPRCHDQLLNDTINMVSVTETVLTEYLEN